MRHALLAGLIVGLSGVTTASQAAEPLDVVASFSVLADMAEQVGGEHVEVTSLVGPDSDSHVYTPSPVDVRRIAGADLVIFNGLQLEGWMNRLLDASGYRGVKVVATDGIDPLHFTGADHGEDGAEGDGHDDHAEHAEHATHDHGDLDPHAWLDVGRAEQYVANIRDGLIAADPAHADAYRRRADDYLTRLDSLDAEIHRLIDAIPASRRVVVSGHDAFDYFADAYGVRFLSPVGLNTAAEPAAADMASLIDFLKHNRIPALFYENITSPALIRQLAEETGIPVAGTLYSGALAAEGEAATYEGMMRHNAKTMHDGLAGAK
ncbi:metal ABC transporter solute-binding protein, Zn/Mn family [Modicisalibacter tunisiensis]|uniref:Zinc ABC transporter substrate-binding protein n=1 Tax=Modicisalibacter tunisiensis TaxID=390637 RepID=A0ABS7WZC4_9GAMM|nr:zinc ABC transporter substrate-binding protein [Modicisalibacter tunisiensis]MBZ9567071.1 zinc ABC transporter substrate-binding protein [Modicisalibacter tunisiensis]